MKKALKLPKGWTEKRVQSVIRYYDNQTEEEAIAEAEEVFGKGGYAVMEIPRILVDKVRALIAREAKSKRSKAA